MMKFRIYIIAIAAAAAICTIQASRKPAEKSSDIREMDEKHNNREAGGNRISSSTSRTNERKFYDDERQKGYDNSRDCYIDKSSSDRYSGTKRNTENKTRPDVNETESYDDKRQREYSNSHDCHIEKSSSDRYSGSKRNTGDKTRPDVNETESYGNRKQREYSHDHHSDKSSSDRYSDSNRNTRNKSQSDANETESYDNRQQREFYYFNTRDPHLDKLSRDRYFDTRKTKKKSKPDPIISFTIESLFIGNISEVYNVKYNQKGKVECLISDPVPPNTLFEAEFYGVRVKKDGTFTDPILCNPQINRTFSDINKNAAKTRCQEEVADLWASFYCDGQLVWCGDKNRHFIQRHPKHPGWHVRKGSFKIKHFGISCENPFAKVPR